MVGGGGVKRGVAKLFQIWRDVVAQFWRRQDGHEDSPRDLHVCGAVGSHMYTG